MNFEIILRPALDGDAPALCALAQETYADAFGASMSASDLNAQLTENLSRARVEKFLRVDVVLVAEMNGQMIGYVQFGDYPDVSGAQELRRLYVRATFQNQGIGTQLLRAALEHPQLKNAPRIYLDVWERNLGARRLYERFGFHVVGAQKFQVASGAATDADLIMLRQTL